MPVYLGDEDAKLEVELNREFPTVALSRDDEGLRGWAGRVREHLEGGLPQVDLPLDVRGDAVPADAVLAGAARFIPHLTRHAAYRQIAEAATNQPTGARAVARACRPADPVSVVVPCHRVVRGDGSLGGYRWGLQRKQQMLAKEKGE